MFVRPVRQEVLHVPESPVPLNSPESFNRNPFKFNRPLPEGNVVRDIIFDQDRYYSELVKRFKKTQQNSASCSLQGRRMKCLERNNSALFKLAACKPLKIATQSFIDNEMDQLISSPQRPTGDFGTKSFHPNSPNFDSQHSILDLTHVSRLFVVHAGLNLFIIAFGLTLDTNTACV